MDLTKGSATISFDANYKWKWAMHPDLANVASTFAMCQTGAAPVIALAKLQTNTTRHESGVLNPVTAGSPTDYSHYMNFMIANLDPAKKHWGAG